MKKERLPGVAPHRSRQQWNTDFKNGEKIISNMRGDPPKHYRPNQDGNNGQVKSERRVKVIDDFKMNSKILSKASQILALTTTS